MRIKTNFYKINAYSNFMHVEMYFAWDERIASGFLNIKKNISELYQEGS